MKSLKFKKYVLAFLLMFAVTFSYAQMTSPSDPGGDPEAGPPLGGGAPIGGGIGILLTLGAVYGGRKIYFLTRENLEELED